MIGGAMNYRIREWQNGRALCEHNRHDRDLEYLVATTFATEKENGLIQPDRPESALRQEHRRELLQFIESKPRTGIWIAETMQGQYMGLIWASVSENRELWDFQPAPAWVYDIRVEPAFRRQGLGARLLQHAEAWACREGFARIGLHVFAHNRGAIRLYRSAGYGIKNGYVQKELASEEAALCSPMPFRIRTRQAGDDTARFRALGYQRFEALARIGQEVPTQILVERYDTWMDRRDYDRPNHRVYVAEDADGTFAGYIWGYVSQGDLGDKKYTWIQDWAVSPAFWSQGLEGQLFDRIEQWTRAQGLGTIRTSIHGHDLAAWRRCRLAGYVETNYFMEKWAGSFQGGTREPVGNRCNDLDHLLCTSDAVAAVQA